MATCFLKQKTSAFTWKRYENFTEGLIPRQEPGVEQADQPENLSVARENLAATHVGNYALFGGGHNFSGHYYNVVDAYNTSLEKSTPTPLSQARSFLAATHVGNYALFAGGYNNDYVEFSNVVDAYDISLNRITPTPNPTPLIVKRRRLAATHVGNYALFGGGELIGTGTSQYMSTVDAYDLSLNRTTAIHLSIGRKNLAATNVGNYALFGGGNSGNVRDSNTVDAYDSLLNKVNTINLSRNKEHPVATHVGNYALFAGQHYYSGDVDDPRSPTIDAYDTPLNRTTIDLPEGYKDYGAATHIGDYALFAGGSSDNGRTLDTVYVYNSSLERSSTQNLDIGKAYLAATHVGDYALFAGGYTKNGDGSDYNTSTVDAYQENQEVCDFPVIPNSIYKFEPYGSETTASEFSKVTVNYPVNGYAKYMSTTLN